jgi:serine phosphatase RsbU (regulator of sigma subunit)
MTLSAIRVGKDGAFEIAGAHEPPVIHRRASGACEIIEMEGTWIGVIRDVAKLMPIMRYRLAPGDTLWLYTDGVIEAMNERRKQFGLDRLCDVLHRHPGAPVEVICGRIFDALLAWSPTPADDATVLGVRYIDSGDCDAP